MANSQTLLEQHLSTGRSERRSEYLAHTAMTSLLHEVDLSPKPGLVDPRHESAHDDMTVAHLYASAHALHPTFLSLAKIARGREPDVALREEIGCLGRTGEADMERATHGINTHRGALWALGLLVCGAANAKDAITITDYARRLSLHPDRALTTHRSHGLDVARRYRVTGARGEAHNGFPHALLALEVVRRSKKAGMTTTQARLTALLELIAQLEDTCLLYRGGLSGLRYMQNAARTVLDLGGVCTLRGRQALQQMDHEARHRRLSPGGSGDLLAAAVFLDDITTSPEAL